jgi:predicted nuclease of predicted toxin-antitoxin system
VTVASAAEVPETAAKPLRIWIDAQLPPVLATYLTEVPGVEATHTFALGMLGSSDRTIFEAARAECAVVMTKDADFVTLVERWGAPPQIVWITAGNVSNAALRALVSRAWPTAVDLLRAGEMLVEISDRRD